MTDEPGSPEESRDRVSRAEERDRLLAEVLAHTEVHDTQQRVWVLESRRPGLWKPIAAAVILLMAGMVALARSDPFGVAAPPEPAAADLERGLRSTLYLQAQRIEAFRIREGRLPGDAEELGGLPDGIAYVRSARSTYQLMGFASDGSTVVYDSARPTETFDRAVASWSLRPSGER